MYQISRCSIYKVLLESLEEVVCTLKDSLYNKGKFPVINTTPVIFSVYMGNLQ